MGNSLLIATKIRQHIRKDTASLSFSFGIKYRLFNLELIEAMCQMTGLYEG